MASVVLDCEAVAYDRVAKKILPFQVPATNCLVICRGLTSTRACPAQELAYEYNTLRSPDNTLPCMQILSTRKRKDVKVEDVQVMVRRVRRVRGTGHASWLCTALDQDPRLVMIKLAVSLLRTSWRRRAMQLQCVHPQVCLYAFDCLYLNGETLLQQPLSARREKLYSALIESPGELWFAEAKARPMLASFSPPSIARKLIAEHRMGSEQQLTI